MARISRCTVQCLDTGAGAWPPTGNVGARGRRRYRKHLPKALDSLVHTRGLSPPTLNQRGWSMSSSLHAASSPAGIAGTARPAPHRKRVDFATGCCGLSPPTLFERIGILATDSQPLPTRLRAARRRCAMRVGKRFTEFLDTAKTTPTAVASGPARPPSRSRLDNRERMAVDKPSSRPTVSRQPRRRGTHARAGPFA
jgi:hypothetical protein